MVWIGLGDGGFKKDEVCFSLKGDLMVDICLELCSKLEGGV